MAEKAKVDYDEDNDILWVYTGEKASDSLEVDKFVIDFSSANKVVGIEIFNASAILSNLLMKRIDKKAISEIKEAKIGSYQSRELTYIIVGMLMAINNEMVMIPLQVSAPKMAISV